MSLYKRWLVEAAHAEHTASTRTEDEAAVPSEIAEMLRKVGLAEALGWR